MWPICSGRFVGDFRATLAELGALLQSSNTGTECCKGSNSDLYC